MPNEYKFHASDGSLGGCTAVRKEARTFTNKALSARGNSNYVSKELGGDAFVGGRELVVHHGQGRQLLWLACSFSL